MKSRFQCRKFFEMSEASFCRDNNEEDYIERCGEIFLTSMDEMIIHCTMCEEKFRGFNAFVIHMNKEHYVPLEVEAIKQQQGTQAEHAAISQHEFADKNTNEIFDLNFLDDCLMNMEQEILNEFIQMLPDDDNGYFNKTPPSVDKASQTGPETPPKWNDNDTQIMPVTPDSNEEPTLQQLSIEALPGVRAVRKSNFQTSIEYRPHKCPVCGMGFQDKANMKHHMERHSTDKNHECLECRKRFYTGYELRIHSKIHTGERPFPCSSCTQSFRTRTRLLIHEKRHTNQRDFKCSECGKEFYEKRILQEHMETHNINRRFACGSCDAVFRVKRSLMRHEKIHAKLKTLFKCQECRAVFVQERALRTHMEKKHQDC